MWNTSIQPLIDFLQYSIGAIVALVIGYWRFAKGDRKQITELKLEIRALTKEKYICNNKRANLQNAYDMAFNHYENVLTPQQMGMLKDIRKLIHDE